MTTTTASLLRAILETPADDALRLVMADALSDEGQEERAEFIRLQIRLVDHPAHHTAESGCPLRRRERELFKDYPAWVPQAILDVPSAGLAFQLKEMPTPEGYVGGVWRRGFIDSIVLPLADWLAHGPQIVACQPVTRVVLTDRRPVGPLSATINGVYRQTWSWERRAGDRHGENIPAGLFDRLTSGALLRYGTVRAYNDADAAHSDLSLAAVNHARHAAALPPLAPG